jgi:protein-S-isoprenylcysteine O-methyltransferase Ste14
MDYPAPVSAVQFALAVASILLFAAAVFAKRLGMPKPEAPVSARSRLSISGIALQSFAFFIVSFGGLRIAAPEGSWQSVIASVVVLASGLAACLLFFWSARVLGANWSVVARTRAEHGLVRHGPFARIRHPIYFAMLLLLIAIAVGFGHELALIPGIPVFVTGTMIRVREEERLLRAIFGEDHARYVREVPAFIPFIG